jgi:AraC-like DNA-binding protein
LRRVTCGDQQTLQQFSVSIETRISLSEIRMQYVCPTLDPERHSERAAMASAAGGLTCFHFSTENLPRDQWLPIWHEVYGRSLTRRIFTLPDSPLLRVHMTVQMLGRARDHSSTGGGVRLMRMSMSEGGTTRRTPELLSDGNDDVILYIQETGRRMVSQLGREVTVGPRGGVLTSNADASTIVLPEAPRLVGIGLPRKLMMALAPGLEDAFVRPLPPNPSILRLLSSYLNVLDDEDTQCTPELQHAVATHIHDLCALVIGATRDATEIAAGRGLRAARLRAIKADIVRNLREGGVSVHALAVRHRLTARYIQRLFESEGTTLSRYVLGQRLGEAHRMLVDPRHADRAIATIAYDVGFGDLSTFNREFRRLFGATPSDVRAAGQD